ncbi:MAG: methyltransferase domain-containing protein [Chloroflexota bacterium]
MTSDDTTARELADRILDATLGLFDIATIYVGEQLGLYRALGSSAAMTPSELASATGTGERFVREWCEQQAAGGILDCDDLAAEPGARRFVLPAGHREVLAERDGPDFAAGGIPGLVTALAALRGLPDLARVTPGLVPTDAAEAAAQDGRGEANRPLYRHLLAGWLAAVPNLHARLGEAPPARVLDVACGAGWSSLAIATAYPAVRVDAIDLDEAVIALARRHADEADLGDRVAFRAVDAADPGLEGPYDLVTCFEALHDMVDPVRVIATWRRLLAPGGTCLVVDVRAEPAFTAPAGRLERLAYGWSVVDCLPATMGSPGSAATGAVMRPATLERYALAAGFSGVEILPIEDSSWRFYRLRR